MTGDTTVKIFTTIGTLGCFALLFAMLGILLFHLCQKRSHRIPYVRNYKKGGFVLNYVIMMWIYFVGLLYDGKDVLEAIPTAVVQAIDSIALKLNTASVGKLMADSILYTLLVYSGYFLVLFGTVLFALSVAQQYLWSKWHSICIKHTRKERLFLFGYSADILSVCRTDSERRFKYIIAKLSKEEKEKLYIEGVPYADFDPEEWAENNIAALLAQTDRKTKTVFFIHTGNDKKNVTIGERFAEALTAAPVGVQKTLFEKVSIYVLGDPMHQAVYENIMKKGHGCIHYVNKYQKIAMDLFDRYPITMFMDETQIDYKNSLLKPDVDVNIALIGFGKTNRQVLFSSVALYQFLSDSADGPVHKPVKYFVFDKDAAEQNKNMNHDYYRFKQKKKTIDPTDYLPLPELPAEEYYEHINVNDDDFYPTLKQIITRSKRDANFIVVAFGDDLENLDMAHRIVEKCKEWDVPNVTIFVRAFEWRKEQTSLADNDNCHFFGNESKAVFDIDVILASKIYKMAKMRTEHLDIERAITRGDVKIHGLDPEHLKKELDKQSARADEKWYTVKAPMQRETALYACLSLRSKLHLMGLDYVPVGADGIPLSEEEYLQRYAGEDRPVMMDITLPLGHKPIVDYGIDYPPSRRRNMAMQEHNRWTAYVISKGMIPATRKEILTEPRTDGKRPYTDGKNYALRRHGNLTTFEGLVEFRKMLAERDQAPEVEKDRIRFRYQLLDDAYWLLTQNGYKIVDILPSKKRS